MKRILYFAVAAALLFSNAAAAQKLLCTQKVLGAIAGERAAVARYEAAALKADAEGYKGAAALFRAAAKAEQIHAGRFAAALKNGSDAAPIGAASPATGSTIENLRAASIAEQMERDATYREAINACQDADPAVAKLFDVTRDAEVEHLNLFSDATRHLDNLKDAKTFYVCDHCGYTTDVKLPLCPSCRDQHAMVPVE